MNRRKIYNQKGNWKREFKQLDVRVLTLLNYERSGAIDVALTEYIVCGHNALKLGLTGEEILDKMVKLGMSDKTIAEMRNNINMIEVFSNKLKAIAEAKWRGELENFPVFKSSTATVGDLIEKTRAIREMNELLEE